MGFSSPGHKSYIQCSRAHFVKLTYWCPLVIKVLCLPEAPHCSELIKIVTKAQPNNHFWRKSAWQTKCAWQIKCAWHPRCQDSAFMQAWPKCPHFGSKFTLFSPIIYSTLPLRVRIIVIHSTTSNHALIFQIY